MFKQTVPQCFWEKTQATGSPNLGSLVNESTMEMVAWVYLTPLTPFPACPHSLQSEKKNPTSLPPRQETIMDGLNAVLHYPILPQGPASDSQILQHYSRGTVCGRTEAPTWDDRTVNIPSETEPGQGNPPGSAST